jgi:hypothetical protein
MVVRLAALMSRLAAGVASTVGVRHGTEEPLYDVEQTIDGVQIRRYGPRIAAETTVEASTEVAARRAGFRRLAGYIFGGNHRGVNIAMTAPVAQQLSNTRAGEKIVMTAPVSWAAGPDGAWVIRFFMPAKRTMDTLPVPDDPAVTLVIVPAETVAVRRFRGNYGAGAVAAHTSKLLNTLHDNDFELAGTPVTWYYDPPWTIPALRRTEIAVPVTARGQIRG